MKQLVALGGLSVMLAASALAVDAKKGSEVFENNCGVCHNATSTEAKMGPGLKGLFKKAALNNKKKPSDATVLEMINNGGTGMPAMKDQLTKAEKDDLLAYLKTL
jgi:cytochrome c